MSRDLPRSPSSPPGDAIALSPVPLLIALFAGPILWSLHLLVSVILVSSACAANAGGIGGALVAGLIGGRLALVAVSLIFIVAVGAVDLLALQCWRRSRVGLVGDGVTGVLGGAPGRTGWMSLAGVLLNTFFLIGILFAAVPLIWLTTCGS